MNSKSFVKLLTTAGAGYLIFNLYILIKLWDAIPSESSMLIDVCASLIFLFLFTAYPVGRLIERYTVTPFVNTLVRIGSFWLAASMYIFLMLVIVDIISLINSVVSFLPEAMTEDLQTTNILVALAIILITAIIIARGYVNASTIKVNALSVTFYRNEHLGKELTITVLSDLHLGTNMGKDKVEEMVQTVNSLQPDLVLIAGDIIDENIEPLLHDNLTQPLKKITAPMGVYAVPGNHEHLGGIQMVSRVLAQSGITLLRDSVVKAGDWVTVAGRDDIAAAEMTGKKRKDLPTLLSGIDTTLPLIVMDHRPLELDEIEAQGVDLFVAGHTHAGQLWPFGLFIRRSYELLTGILRRHSANYYVTSGVGTWGPPIRIGSKSEIVNLVVEFKAQVDPNLLHGGKQGGTRGSLDLS